MRAFPVLGTALVLSAAVAIAELDLALPETEQCGKWILKFDWADQYDYSKRLSQVTAETGGSRIITDTIILSSVADPKKMVKISIMKYGKRTPALVDPLSLKNRTNETLAEWGACKNFTTVERSISIDKRPGAFSSGTGCSGGRPVWAAIYPVDYYYDRSARAMVSNALGIIVSSYDQETTMRLISSIHIEGPAQQI